MTESGGGNISGVVRAQLNPIGDERGAFMELWRASATDAAGATFRQANLSRSQPRVLRGMHFHDRQLDLWIVLSGRASVALVDLRVRIDGRGGALPTEEFELTAGGSVLIPKRVAHGFLAMEALELLYLVTNEYDGTDEHGFGWSDPAVGLSWPISDPIVSSRDASNPSVETAIEAANQRDALLRSR
jgi:dTDP-4-dehydrorhamnose 3,5-epimerase